MDAKKVLDSAVPHLSAGGIMSNDEVMETAWLTKDDEKLSALAARPPLANTAQAMHDGGRLQARKVGFYKDFTK
jgi:hypothetical protein